MERFLAELQQRAGVNYNAVYSLLTAYDFWSILQILSGKNFYKVCQILYDSNHDISFDSGAKWDNVDAKLVVHHQYPVRNYSVGWRAIYTSNNNTIYYHPRYWKDPKPFDLVDILGAEAFQ